MTVACAVSACQLIISILLGVQLVYGILYLLVELLITIFFISMSASLLDQLASGLLVYVIFKAFCLEYVQEVVLKGFVLVWDPSHIIHFFVPVLLVQMRRLQLDLRCFASAFLVRKHVLKMLGLTDSIIYL